MHEMPDASRPTRSVSATILQWFVDRVEELRLFRKMLAGRDPAQVLLVKGPKDDWTGKLSNGIGKTWLLKRLHREAEEKGFAVCAIDFSFGEALDDLWLIHRTALGLGSFHFETLNRTLDDATRLEVVLKVESSPGGGGVTFLGDAEIIGDVAGRDIIKDNTFYLQADSPAIRRIWQESINKAFFLDLAQLGLAEGVTFLFDSFEQAPQEARSWIEHQMLRHIGDGELPGVWMVIAGEEVPSLSSAWGDLKVEKHLEPLPQAEVRKYLKDKRRLIISEATVSKVYDITGGRPDLVALIADSPGGLPEEPTADRLLEILVEGILDNAESPVPETVRVAAIAEWFDAALLAELLDTTTGIDERLTILQGYSFVQADDRGHLRFLPGVRRVLLEAWSGRPTELRELHERAAHHFDDRAQKAADPRWREELERQAMGHWLVADEREGQERLRALFESAEADYRLTTCELLLHRAEGVKGLTRQTQDWLGYFQGRLALARNHHDASSTMFTALLEETEPHNELHELAGWSLGELAAVQGEWAEAIDHYESSLRYFQGQADQVKAGQVMLALGDVYLQQARALGGLIRPQLARGTGVGEFLGAIPAFLVVLPFVIYAWAIRRWRFLPPLHHGMNYRNWTLARLLLTAVEWYRDAGHIFVEAGQEALLADACQRLAQAYHRLGWWHYARRLFDELLCSRAVVSNAYRQAQVRKEYADTALAAGNLEEAIDHLEKALKTFEHYRDVQAQARTCALLGQAWLRKGDFERGLALYRKSLAGLSAVGDRLGTGLALHALRRWVQQGDPTSEQATQIETLIADMGEKTYLPRVPDRMATVLELIVLIGLVVLGVLGLIILAVVGPGLNPVSDFYTGLLAINTLLRVFARLILFIWAFVVGSSLLGLLLILWGTRRKLEPERLDRIVTSHDAVSRYNYRGQKVSRILWRDVQATLSIERTLWRKPIPLLSEFWLFGSSFCVPATMLWYDALKGDIEDHLRKYGVQPARRQWDVHVLLSWLGLLFVLSPIFLGLWQIIVWNVFQLPIPLSLAALAGPVFWVLGVVALVAGPYWWLVLHPLRVRYGLTPRSRIPLLAGGVGLVIVAFALLFGYSHPFFPIRNWMNQTVHPLGFMLIIVAPLWILTARELTPNLIKRGAHVYQQPWARRAAGVALVGALLLTGLFAQREWIPYFYIFRAITYFHHGDYGSTITVSTRVLEMNADLADGYFYRAVAYSEVGEHQLALIDLSHLISARGVKLPHYHLFRAEEYEALDESEAACADLRFALDARRWRLDENRRTRAEKNWQDWNCENLSAKLEGGEGSLSP